MVFNFDIPENNEEVTEEIVIDDSIVDDSEDIQDTFNLCDEFCMQYNNLVLIQSHVKKFGFNKQMLHLLNSNNNLFKMLDLDMPDLSSQTEDANLDEQVDEVIVKLNMEADFTFYDTVKKAKDEFIRIFNLIINKFKEVYRAFTMDINSLNKKLVHLRKEVYGSNGRFIDEAKTLEKEIKACTPNEWNSAISALSFAVHNLKKKDFINFDRKIGFVGLDGLIFKNALAVLNYEIALNTSTGFLVISRKEAPNSFEKKSLKDLSWTVDETYKKLSVSLSYVLKMKEANSIITFLEKEKVKLLADESIKVSKAIVLNQVKTLVHICNIIMDGFKKYLSILINIADKAVMKKG